MRAGRELFQRVGRQVEHCNRPETGFAGDAEEPIGGASQNSAVAHKGCIRAAKDYGQDPNVGLSVMLT